MKQRIITVTGRSGSGKTTLIEKLIVYYKIRNKKVSVIKSMRHEFDVEPDGKDTRRYRESGASASIITNGRKFAFISETVDEQSPLDLAVRYFADSDIIIIEGFKDGNIRKIEVIGDSAEKPLFLDDPDIKFIVTDKNLETTLPVYKRDDIAGIAEEIEKL